MDADVDIDCLEIPLDVLCEKAVLGAAIAQLAELIGRSFRTGQCLNIVAESATQVIVVSWVPKSGYKVVMRIKDG